MLATTKQDEITSEINKLQKSLNDEIRKMESSSEINIINHICINNLKSKRERLEEIKKILSIDKYKIVFIGTIGQGKTTAICHLFNLISDFKGSKTIAGKTRDVIETKELLSTGSGRTTICEVVLKASDKTYIEIEPYSVDEMENLIFEFCESIASKENSNPESKVIISQEIERAIRNITELKITFKTVDDGDKKRKNKTDIAQVLFQEQGLEGLQKIALDNASLESRTSTTIEFDNQTKEQEWIKNTFAAINNAQLKEFAIPRKIYLYVSNDVLSGSNLSQFDSVVDTKGLDENPIRQDLERYIYSQDTICLFVTPFNAAPESSIRELMGYHLTSKSKQFHHRFVTLVLPRKGEPEKVHGADEDRDLGIQIRQEQVQAAFKNLNLEFFQDNILFYDSLKYYRDDIVKLIDPDYEEDVQADKNEFLEAIAGVVERRKNILLDEIKSIRESFSAIKNGDALTYEEIKAIENIIDKIEDVRDLRKRVSSFVYEDLGFIDQYIQYYRDVYKAWNTKHAIHRRFGYYEERNIDIDYDAKVVAEGKDENEMLKKFTKEVKQELESVLYGLKDINESLDTLIPDLVKEFYELYDEFVYNVGKEIQGEFKRKLSPHSEESKFWNALINEKGRERSIGETYTDNVCEIFKEELEKETSLNALYQNVVEENWTNLVTKILAFFGQK